MPEDLGARNRPVIVWLDWCSWCETSIDPELEEFSIRRYLAAGGWADVAYHTRCYVEKMTHPILGIIKKEDLNENIL